MALRLLGRLWRSPSVAQRGWAFAPPASASSSSSSLMPSRLSFRGFASGSGDGDGEDSNFPSPQVQQRVQPPPSRSVLPVAVARVEAKPRGEKEWRRKQQLQQLLQPQAPQPVERGVVHVVSCHEVAPEKLRTILPTAVQVEKGVCYFAEDGSGCVRGCDSLTVVFPYGVCVFWGVSPASRHSTLELVNRNGVPGPKLLKVDFSTIQEDDNFTFSHQPPPLRGGGRDEPPSKGPPCGEEPR
eukprot:RCo034420